MNKKIKIIDLILLIKENKQPNKIMYEDNRYEYDKVSQDYYDTYLDEYLIYSVCGNNNEWLNVEVEILDEEQLDELEELDIKSDEATPNSYYIVNEYGTKCYMTKHSKTIADKLNIAIKHIKKLEEQVKNQK